MKSETNRVLTCPFMFASLHIPSLGWGRETLRWHHQPTEQTAERTNRERLHCHSFTGAITRKDGSFRGEDQEAAEEGGVMKSKASVSEREREISRDKSLSGSIRHLYAQILVVY